MLPINFKWQWWRFAWKRDGDLRLFNEYHDVVEQTVDYIHVEIWSRVYGDFWVLKTVMREIVWEEV